jgi:hypothetical protein
LYYVFPYGGEKVGYEKRTVLYQLRERNNKLGGFMEDRMKVLEEKAALLSGSAFKVLFLLCVGAEGKAECVLTYAQLAEKTGLKASHMRDHVLELEDKGLTEATYIARKGRGGGGVQHTFRLLI